MRAKQDPSKVLHIILWVVQIILALFFISGTILKFLSIEKISAMMPWTGELPLIVVRLLGVIDLFAALGLILPSLLRIKPNLTPWTALWVIIYMVCASAFHISRGEVSVIGANIFAAVFAAFIAWGRFKKAVIVPK